MKQLSLMAIVVAGLSACHPATAPVPTAQCPAWKNIDLSSLPKHIHDDPNHPLYEDFWSAWANQPSDIAWTTTDPKFTIHFITSPSGLSTDPYVREVIGKQSEGGWEIYARSAYSNAPRRPDWTVWHPVRLTPQGERRLASILGDPCLWAAPRFIEETVRLSNGRGVSLPDGPSTGYDVTQGNRRWGGWHFSWSVGPPGQLRSILLSEAFGIAAYSQDEIGPEGSFNWPSQSR